MTFKDIAFKILFFVLISATVHSQEPESTLLFYGGIGSYNKGYSDKEFLDNNKVTFPVFMSNFGGEYHSRKNDYTFGLGLVQTSISEGKKWNYDGYEVQPLTIITLPYVFVGRDFGFWSYEIGLSYYIYMQKFDARYYMQTDGTEAETDSSGVGLDRSESHVFINSLIRIFPEKSLHLKLRIGREQFNIVDSLLNIAFVVPAGNHEFDFIVSFPPPENWFTNKDGIIRSNQIAGIEYGYTFLSDITAGMDIGCIINNRRGGEGDIKFFNRLSGSLFLKFSL
jgi:hypothetical protein